MCRNHYYKIQSTSLTSSRLLPATNRLYFVEPLSVSATAPFPAMTLSTNLGAWEGESWNHHPNAKFPIANLTENQDDAIPANPLFCCFLYVFCRCRTWSYHQYTVSSSSNAHKHLIWPVNRVSVTICKPSLLSWSGGTRESDSIFSFVYFWIHWLLSLQLHTPLYEFPSLSHILVIDIISDVEVRTSFCTGGEAPNSFTNIALSQREIQAAPRWWTLEHRLVPRPPG